MSKTTTADSSKARGGQTPLLATNWQPLMQPYSKVVVAFHGGQYSTIYCYFVIISVTG